MTTTAKNVLRRPVLTDTSNVPRDVGNLADDIDGRLITYCTEATPSDTRPTGTARYEGAVVYCTDTDAIGIWDGTTWRMWDNAPQLYTPVVSSSGSAISQGSFFGRYFRRGKMVHSTMRWVTASLGGSVDTAFTLPPVGNANITNMPLLRGEAHIVVSGQPGWFFGGVRISSSTQFQCYFPNSQGDNRTNVLRNTDGSGGAGAGIPAISANYTLVSGTEVTAAFEYELA